MRPCHACGRGKRGRVGPQAERRRCGCSAFPDTSGIRGRGISGFFVHRVGAVACACEGVSTWSVPMNAASATEIGGWSWWERRRLTYNIALAVAGCAAYGLNAVFYVLFVPVQWWAWDVLLSSTFILGVLYLLVMGAANIFYCL